MKIALVGSAPSSVHLAPYKDKSSTRNNGKVQSYPPAQFVNDEWEVWACSPGAYGVAPRITRFFEVHRWEPGQTWFSPEYCQFLSEFRGPVYVGGYIPQIKNAVRYPTDEVEAEFSAYFLTSSLALMFAIAIMEIEKIRKARRSEGPTNPGGSDRDDTIGMWGVDMSAGEEWEYQRPGCQFFILEALRRGIEVYIPPESDILKPMPIYGVSEWDTDYIKATARARELNSRIQMNAANAAEATKQQQYLQGAVDNMSYVVKTFMSPWGLPPGRFLTQQPGTGLGSGRGLTLVNDPEADPFLEPLPASITTAEHTAATPRPKVKAKRKR